VFLLQNKLAGTTIIWVPPWGLRVPRGYHTLLEGLSCAPGKGNTKHHSISLTKPQEMDRAPRSHRSACVVCAGPAAYSRLSRGWENHEW